MAVEEGQKNITNHFLNSGRGYIFQWVFIALAANTYWYFPFPQSMIQLAIVLVALFTYSQWRPEKRLHEAAKAGNVELVREILDHQKNVNICSITGETALHYACRFSTEKMVSFLIDNGANVNSLTNTCETPLHWSVAGRVIEKVNILIRSGADINFKDDLGRTPLHWAVTRNLFDMALLLIESNADTDIQSKDGKTLIEIADENECEAIASLLRRQSDRDGLYSSNLTSDGSG